MKKIIHLIMFFALSLTLPLSAQESQVEMAKGFVSDELFVYMHTGAGNNYRILGSVTAGSEVKLTGLVENNYTQIMDKDREAWVESKYITKKPGLRFVVAELNSQLASATDLNSQLDAQLNDTKSAFSRLNDKNSQLNNDIASLNNQLSAVQGKLKDQDTNLKKEWFFNGAIVIAIGIFIGLILPFLASKRRKRDSWT